MNGETWTEYAVEDGSPQPLRCSTYINAIAWQAKYGGRIVGRTVTATPWLPVQDQP